MTRFKEPGFKTRQNQRDIAQGRKPAPEPKAKTDPFFRALDRAQLAFGGGIRRGAEVRFPRLERPRAFDWRKNACAEVNVGLPLPSWMMRDMMKPLELHEIPSKFRKPAKIQAVEKFARFDTHQPREASSAFASPENYCHHLKKRGFVRLGKGHYSTVLGHPKSKRVIKVCHRAENDAYPMFAEWAHQNPSPYLPVIHSFKRHERREAFYVVVLDRMETTVGCTSPEAGWRDATAALWTFTQRPSREQGQIRHAIQEAIFNSLPGIKELLIRMHREFHDLAHFDMHDENWMLSQDGQLVITDPLSGASSGRSRQRNQRVSRIKGSVRLTG